MQTIQRALELVSRKFWDSETAVMTTLALLVGGTTGLGIAVFRRTLDGIFEWSIVGWGSAVPLTLLFFPALGGILVAVWMSFFRHRDETGLGVAGIMEAVALHSGRISWRGSLMRVLGAVLTVGLGGSAGPEDPSVQIGAAIGSQVGQRLKLADTRVNTLVGCGAAAGIGAAFNAPISGVFFAIELILGEFSGAAIGLVVLAAVSGSIVIQSLLGRRPAFEVPPYELINSWELGLYALLGLAAAFVAVLYARLVDRTETFFEHWRIPVWAKPAIGGLGVGVLAYLINPGILGTGYPVIGNALQGKVTLPMVLFLLLGLKLLATPLTLGSGGQGGLFAPSLFLGAMLGVGFGLVAQVPFAGTIAPAAAYGLVGMGAVLAGAVRAPITAILLPFELTQDYHIILPLMFATVISTTLARRLEPESIYTVKHKRRGLDLFAKRDANLMRQILVQDAMTPRAELTAVHAATSIQELARLFQSTSHHGFLVLDERENLYGIVALEDLEKALASGNSDAKVGDICTRQVVTAYPEDTLEDALRHFGALDVGRIPVVDRRSPRHVVGVLRRGDIIHAYSHALLQQQRRASRLERARLESLVGSGLLELDLPTGAFAAGRTIKEIPLPADVTILAVRRGGRLLAPRGGTDLQAGDHLIVLASAEQEEKVRQALLGTFEASEQT